MGVALTPELLRLALTRFYEIHNPSRVGDVDGALQHFRGREAELISKVAAKYGVKERDLVLFGVTSPLKEENDSSGEEKNSFYAS